MGREQDLQKLHDQGQRDAANGIVEKPYGVGAELADIFSGGLAGKLAGTPSMQEDNEAYMSGVRDYKK